VTAIDVGANRALLLGGRGVQDGGCAARREERVDVVRLVEYAPYPRVFAHQQGRLGFTRDLSPSGMCLRVEAPERVGSLLRIAVRDVDGRPAREAVARVAWRSGAADGAFWIGLSLVEACPRRPLRARRSVAAPLLLAHRRRA
jgi:hypothetical protein